MTSPNLSQQNAISATDGPVLIIAGPGSGKTFMLTHGQSEFYIQYIDPESQTVRSYYPDFLYERDDGKWIIVEVKGDNKIDDPVVQAKKQYAEQMALASGMEYRVIKGSDADAHGYSRVIS